MCEILKQATVIGLLLLFPTRLLADCVPYPDDLRLCVYERYSVFVSCEQNGAVMSFHDLGKDTGQEDTKSRNYKLDPDVDLSSCQQSSDDTYSSHVKGYDVGHLAAINHFDDNQAAALETNYMTNLLPQASSLNRSGAWRETEKLIECYRDEPGFESMEIYQGPVFGDDASNDHYAVSHDLPQTPDFYWKIAYSVSGNAYDAWLMPNSNDIRKNDLPDTRRALEAIESTLINEGKPFYNPVIQQIQALRLKKPEMIELTWFSGCGTRGS